MSEYAGLIPEFLQPDDIGSVALFLSSGEARRINGAIVIADVWWTAT